MLSEIPVAFQVYLKFQNTANKDRRRIVPPEINRLRMIQSTFLKNACSFTFYIHFSNNTHIDKLT